MSDLTKARRFGIHHVATPPPSPGERSNQYLRWASSLDQPSCKPLGHRGWSATPSWARALAGVAFRRPVLRLAAGATPGLLCAGRDSGFPMPRRAWGAAATNRRQKLIARDDVDLVDICTPAKPRGSQSRRLQAGKHVFSRSRSEHGRRSQAMTAVAERAIERGVRSMVGFNYRRVPALAPRPTNDRRRGLGTCVTCGPVYLSGLDLRSAVPPGVALRKARRARARSVTSSTSSDLASTCRGLAHRVRIHRDVSSAASRFGGVPRCCSDGAPAVRRSAT